MVPSARHGSQTPLAAVGLVGLRWFAATVDIASTIAFVVITFDAFEIGRPISADPVSRLRWIVLLGAVGAVLRLLNQRSTRRTQVNSPVDAT
jgi:hypothetical protein